MSPNPRCSLKRSLSRGGKHTRKNNDLMTLVGRKERAKKDHGVTCEVVGEDARVDEVSFALPRPSTNHHHPPPSHPSSLAPFRTSFLPRPLSSWPTISPQRSTSW